MGNIYLQPAGKYGKGFDFCLFSLRKIQSPPLAPQTDVAGAQGTWGKY